MTDVKYILVCCAHKDVWVQTLSSTFVVHGYMVLCYAVLALHTVRTTTNVHNHVFILAGVVIFYYTCTTFTVDFTISSVYTQNHTKPTPGRVEYTLLHL